MPKKGEYAVCPPPYDQQRMSLSEEDMKRTAAILLSTTVSLVHPAATALGQEPNIAIPTGTVIASSGSDTGQSEEKAEGQEARPQVGDTMAVEAPVGDSQQVSPNTQVAVQIAVPSTVLMGASTRQVIYERGADEKRSPASVTKVMVLILTFDALQSGEIQLMGEMIAGAHAKPMGSPQIFLEEGEVRIVETLIKCIVTASGDDASVATAEYAAGTEEEFVQMMNRRAIDLGITSTHLVDCCGLTESPEHLTTARDVVITSRELINKYPQIYNYSTIWMENVTHVTKQRTKEFGLSNTNRPLKMAANFKATGLKTGLTSIAGYCLSITAEKDGVWLTAAVMVAPDSRARFGDAQTLLNYSYANCKLREDKEHLPLPQMPVTGGVEDEVTPTYEGTSSYLSLKGEDLGTAEKNLVLEKSIPAPMESGQEAGVLEYTLSGKKLGEVNVLTNGSVKEAGCMDYLKRLVGAWKLNRQGTEI